MEDPGLAGLQGYQNEINELAKTLKFCVRRKPGNRNLVCSGCGHRVSEFHQEYEREARDLPCFEYRTTVVIELYRSAVRMAESRRRRSSSCRATGRSANG